MGGNLTFNDNDDVQLKGATDQTLIGNVGDSLKTAVTQSALPTGAATAANQSTEITSLQLIDDVPTAQNGALNKGVPIMGQLDDTSTTAATEDNVAAVRITAQRAAHVNLRNNVGTEIGTSGAPVRTDPTGTTTQPISAASLPLPSGAATSANQTTEITALQILDDVPAAMNAAFSKGAPAMGQLDDTSTTVATEDNVAPVRITPQRSFHVNLRNNAGTELATATNQAFVKDVLNTAIQHRNQAFTSSATQALGAATILSGRKFLSITPMDGTVYWGITGVTSSTGTPIFKNQSFTLSVTDSIQIFCVTASGTVNCRIAEGS